VRLDAMGDVLMSGPAIRALRAGGPAHRSITLLTSPAGAAAGRLLPGVTDVIELRAPWVAEGGETDLGDDLEAVRRLRRGPFEAAVILTTHTQSALPAATWCRLAGIPLRLAHARENPYGLLTDWIPEPEPDEAGRHEVVRQLDLVSQVGGRHDGMGLAVSLPPGAQTRGRTALRRAGVDPATPWLPVHPGAGAPSRRYPAASFARAADLLHRDGWRVVLVGAAGDADDLDRVRSGAEHSPAVVRGLDVAALGGLLSLAPVAVTNNSGPAHLAAAVGTPVVDLYALTNPQHAPWGVEHRLLFHDVPCRNCYRSVCPEGHHACLAGVPPEAVAQAVREMARPSVAAVG
jgi:ADP-heptose:LPS heptosyltransferase